MIATPSNEYKYRLLKQTEGHTYKIILMQTGFVYNKDTHSLLSDVSASELTTGNGYTAGGKTLANITVTKDNDTDKGILAADDVSWTASGGILATAGCIVYNDTMTDDPVAFFMDAEGTISSPDGITLDIKNIRYRIG